MGRKFTESEVLAMTRNRREDKALRETLHKLTEERGFYYDNLKKERKKISQFCRESQRTSGNSPCPDCQESCNKSDHVTPRQMQRHNKPWSVTPSESTFNVLFKQNNFETTESRKMHKRTNALRKSSHSRNSSELRDFVSPVASGKEIHKDTVLESCSEKLPFPQTEEIERALCSTPVPKEEQSQESDIVSIATDVDKYSRNSKDQTNRPKSVRILSPKPNKSSDVVSGSSANQVSEKSECFLQELTSENQTTKTEGRDIRSKVNEKAGPCGSQAERVAKAPARDNPEKANKVTENGNTQENERVKDSICKQVNRNIASKEIGESEEIADRLTLPVLDELPDEESEDKANQEYMMVYTLTDDGKMAEDGAFGNGGHTKHEREGKIFRSQTSLEDNNIQIVSVALENDGTAAITLSHVEKQRPHTVAGGEVFVEDPDLKSLTDVDHRDFMWFRGKKLHNYVKPQERYKHDPFKMKKREKLMKKLATETPVFAEDQREQILNVDMTFSKATRARLLKQLVEENSSKRHTNSRNSYEQTLNSKIDHFMKSIEDFCDKQRHA